MNQTSMILQIMRKAGAVIHTWVRVNGSALKQDSGPSVGQRPIDTVTVSCYPADICHTAEYISIMVAEDILEIRRRDDWIKREKT